MCGICAFRGPEDQDAIARMRRMLCDQEHRGPDGAGLAFWDRKAGWRSGYSRTPAGLPLFYQASSGCVLGHNWLAVIDTRSVARQPMFFQGLGLVFNGEIYNFVELRERLAATGDVFETESDTEVLLHLWHRHGPDCLKMLRGMFAIALYDSNRDVLWAARDPFGIKPLYYARTDQGVFLSSEIRALHGSGLIPRRLREEAVIAAAAAGVNKFGVTNTFYEGIFELPPGHRLKIAGGNIESEAYYRFPDLTCDLEGPDAISSLRSATRESVRLHLQSSRQIATCLSGGLDSSNIVWCIHEDSAETNREFTAFTICTGSHEDSELALAAELTQKTGLRHEIVDQQGVIEPADVLEMIVAYEVPNHVIGPINQFLLLRRVAESGAVVVLDGQGGDELLSGYAWYGSVLLDALVKRGGDRDSLDAQRRAHMPFSIENTQILERMFADPAYWVHAFMGRADFLGVSADLVCELPDTRYYLTGGADWSSLRLREYFRGDLPLLLRQEDRLGMWFGLECRVPFVDREMIDTAAHLTPEILLHDGYLKYPFRHLFPEIPESLRWNTKKRGFWDTNTARFPWIGEVGRAMALNSSMLRRLFPRIEEGWSSLNSDQKWRLLQIAVLEGCATRQHALDLCRETNVASANL
jgi:asparagine synthase (glutamine-hydrolysing)